MNSDIIVRILVLFFFAGAVGFGAGVEASSEAWRHCAMLHDAIRHAKGCDSSSHQLPL